MPRQTEQQLSPQQMRVLQATLRIFHRTRVAGILYAICVHIGHEPDATTL